MWDSSKSLLQFQHGPQSRSFTIMKPKAAPQYVGVSHRYPEVSTSCQNLQLEESAGFFS